MSPWSGELQKKENWGGENSSSEQMRFGERSKEKCYQEEGQGQDGGTEKKGNRHGDENHQKVNSQVKKNQKKHA